MTEQKQKPAPNGLYQMEATSDSLTEEFTGDNHAIRQERRVRWRYGLSKAQARVVAPLLYGGAAL